jgi:glycosyltransferase involved in cell wall biosynthesis
MPPSQPQDARRGSTQRRLDVLIVSLGSTAGLRTADRELCESLARAGAHVQLVSTPEPARVRTLMLTDLMWARAARTAAVRALAAVGHAPPPAVVYSSTTAALLWPRPGAIRYDAPSAANRPGRHGLWQRALERRRLSQAPLLLPWSEGALYESPPEARRGDRALIVPVPVEASGPRQPVRDIAAITYAANPVKKGLDRVLAAWRVVRAGRPTERVLDPADQLVLAGASTQELEREGFSVGAEDGVRVVGVLPAAEYRALLRRARVFVCAPRREDYGLAQLEALADGCLLVTTPSPGPYAALPIARALDGRLVSEDLAGALHAGLLDPSAGYAERAIQALAPFTRAAVDRSVSQALLGRLLG